MNTTVVNLLKPSRNSSRESALEATRRFPPGTIGYGVHAAIQTLYTGIDSSDLDVITCKDFIDGNSFDAEIGNYFNRPDIQKLMSKRFDEPGGKEANLKVATGEYEYWKEVRARSWQKISSGQRSEEVVSDFVGGFIGSLPIFRPRVRAFLQKQFASGRPGFEKAKSRISKTLGPIFREVKDILNSVGIGCIDSEIGFVIDTTGSMEDDIDAVKQSASNIISAIFDPSKDQTNSRVGIVSYKDPGEVTSILNFTDQGEPEIRKTAALNAINSISVGGGGDIPEGVYSGLLYALQGGIGEWGKETKVRRLVLFGDAPPKDDELAGTVNLLSRNVAGGVDIEDVSGVIHSKALSENVFSTKVSLTRAAAAEPISVEIFTVVVGEDLSAQTAFQRIAGENSGRAFTAVNADEVVSVLLQAINERDVGIAPSPINFNGKRGIRRNGTGKNDEFNGTNKNDTLDGRGGNDRLDGENSNDRLLGSKGKDTLLGGNGRDWLLGGNDKDTIMGGSNDDILEGGIGKDVLSGEQGRDLFVFNSLVEKGDIINDFDSNSDLIDLRPIFAQPQFSGSTPFSRFTQFVQVVQTGKNTRVLIDADGSGIGATFTNLVTLKNFSATNISSENFVIL